jgi:hypothetical protein
MFNPKSLLNSFKKSYKSLKSTALGYSSFAYANSRFVGWILVTSTIMTFLPLYLEVMRETELEGLENARIQEGLASGVSPVELANVQGIAGAIDPDVTKAA